MTIAGDSVDPEMVDHPRRWDIGFIRRFMLVFGLISSVFDYLCFYVLLHLLHANTTQFRTGWFVESVVSASLMVLVIRTRARFYQSRPSRSLLIATFAIVVLVLLLPWTPLARPLGLGPLPGVFLPALAAIVAAYVVVAEVAKTFFYRKAAF